MDRRKDELFTTDLRYRQEDAMSGGKGIETAAEHCGYVRSRGYKIVDLKERRLA